MECSIDDSIPQGTDMYFSAIVRAMGLKKTAQDMRDDLVDFIDSNKEYVQVSVQMKFISNFEVAH